MLSFNKNGFFEEIFMDGNFVNHQSVVSEIINKDFFYPETFAFSKLSPLLIRFLNQLKTCQHESLRNAEAKFISAKICEIYSFGNNVFIKILFEMTNDVKEEWAFSKNVLDQNRVWYICSINSVSSK